MMHWSGVIIYISFHSAVSREFSFGGCWLLLAASLQLLRAHSQLFPMNCQARALCLPDCENEPHCLYRLRRGYAGYAGLADF